MWMVSQNRGYIDTTHNILRGIQGRYIKENPDLYTEDELIWINHYLDSVIYKSFLVRVAVEHLQTVKYGRIEDSLWPAIENSLGAMDCSSDEKVLLSFAFEAFLFEARSFLDIYMILVCLLLKTGFSNEQMNKTKFYSLLDKVENPLFSEKAKWFKQYFDTNVFGKENNQGAFIFRNDWGSLLISLRDKISHRDFINFSFESQEKYMKEIILDWPTIKGLTYHSLAETIGNEIHRLFHKGLCHIYEINWDDYKLHHLT